MCKKKFLKRQYNDKKIKIIVYKSRSPLANTEDTSFYKEHNHTV